MERPPIKGVGSLCHLDPPGWAKKPNFEENILTKGVRDNTTMRAIKNAYGIGSNFTGIDSI
jgi:hypothetical protein